MPRRNVKVRTVIAVLEENGFKFSRENKHGEVYVHPDGRVTTIGRHYKNSAIPISTLKAIEHQTGLKF